MNRVPIVGAKSFFGISSGIKKVAAIVSATMGARGRHAFIQTEGGAVIVTKDGANTARSIYLEDPLERIGATMTVEAALKTVDQAGDGTTSTIVLLDAIIRHAHPYLSDSSTNPIVLADQIDDAAKLAVEVIRKNSLPVSGRDSVYNIAKISSNGDEGMANMVCDAIDSVGPDGNVSIIDSPTSETYLEVVTGLRLESGYASPYFINTSKRTCVLENPLIAITNEDFMRVDQIQDMFQAAITQNRPLVLFGADFTGEAMASVLLNVQQGRIKCVLIRTPSVGSVQQEYMEDVAYITGGTFLSQQKGDDITKIRGDNWNDLFGTCEKITVYSDRCVMAGGVAEPEDIESYTDKIAGGLETENNPALRARIEDRIRRLKSGVAIISVGAIMDSERKEKKDRFEDAVLAVQSAIKGGYVPGGGVSYAFAIRKVRDSLLPGFSVMSKALTYPMKTICENAGIAITDQQITSSGPHGIDVMTGKSVQMVEAGIIDPTLVVVSAIENSSKIASMIIRHGGSIIIPNETKNV